MGLVCSWCGLWRWWVWDCRRWLAEAARRRRWMGGGVEHTRGGGEGVCVRLSCHMSQRNVGGRVVTSHQFRLPTHRNCDTCAMRALCCRKPHHQPPKSVQSSNGLGAFYLPDVETPKPFKHLNRVRPRKLNSGSDLAFVGVICPPKARSWVTVHGHSRND